MKHALIAGSLSGLATASIEALLSEGWTVFALDIREEDSVKEGGRLHTIRADLTKKEDLRRAYSVVSGVTSSLDLVSCFAGTVVLGSLVENAGDRMERIFSINVMATVNVNSVFFPMVLEAKGRYCVISSEYGKIAAIPFHGYYPMTKHALEIYADSLRREVRGIGISVVTIRPGAFSTAMQKSIDDAFSVMLAETKLYKAPLLRMKHIMTTELKKAKDPAIFGRVFLRIATKKHPKAHVNVRNSVKMKLLTALPSPVADRVFAFFF